MGCSASIGAIANSRALRSICRGPPGIPLMTTAIVVPSMPDTSCCSPAEQISATTTNKKGVHTILPENFIPTSTHRLRYSTGWGGTNGRSVPADEVDDPASVDFPQATDGLAEQSKNGSFHAPRPSIPA